MSAFVHAWFRSGSTWLWEKFRKDDSFVAFYEPLHEDLPNWTPERIRSPHAMPFDGANHPALDRSYYYEYLPLVEDANLRFDPSISYQRYFLSEDDRDPALENYLDGLIRHAQIQGKRAALCFCRSAMRARWMKRRFGGVHIAQIRNPYDQWLSFRKNGYFVNRTLLTGLCLEKRRSGTFQSIPGFQETFGAWSTGRKVRFDRDQCLLVYIHLWLFSAIQSISISDILVDIDRLSGCEEARRSVSSAMQNHGLPHELSDCRAPRSDSSTPEYQEFNDRFRKVIENLRHDRQSNQYLVGFETIASRQDFLAPDTAGYLNEVCGT